MYKLIASPRGYQDLSFRIARENNTHAEECIANKQNHGNFRAKFSSKVFSRFVKHPEEAFFWIRFSINKGKKHRCYCIISKCCQ